MTPTGNTNVTIGLQMAWQTLSPIAPFNAPAARARSRQGHHPADRRRQHAEPLDQSRQSSIDARTRKGLRQRQGRQYQALHGARDQRQRDAAARTARPSRTCITTWSKASQLNSVFSSIAQNLANLRIAK